MFKVVRLYFNNDSENYKQRVIKRNLTLEDAQAHCNDPETSSITCTTQKSKAITKRNQNGRWFDEVRKQ